MRVLVERGAVSEDVIRRLLRDPNYEVLILDRAELERRLREDDIVIAHVADLPSLGTSTKPLVRFGDLCIGPFCAAFDGEVLALRKIDLAILYELASVQGAAMSREELRRRCWDEPTRLRSVDVAVHRARRRLEKLAPLRIVPERELGYRLALPDPPARKRVLVIEDELPMQRSYRHFFEHLGVDVDFASDVPSALTKIEDNDYDAYFVDLGLPLGDGASLIPVIQKKIQKSNPLTPIVIITGRSDAETVGLSAAHGVVYVAKPFKPKELTRLVRRTVLLEAVQ